MRKGCLCLGGLIFALFLVFTGRLYAADSNPVVGQQVRQEIREQKVNAQSAKAEENQLREQIRAAVRAGDLETAEKLRTQLRLMHRENVQEKVQDKKEIQSRVRQLNNSTQDESPSGSKKPRLRFDNDDNPPGPKGGAGTNWENPPGPRGGSGASPNRKGKR